MSETRLPNTYAVQTVAEIENLFRDAAEILVEAADEVKLDAPNIVRSLVNFRDMAYTAAVEAVHRKARKMTQELLTEAQANALTSEVEKFLKDLLKD